jgi:hypothetical protein
MMAKEETGEVEERLDKLEAEQLRMAREFGKQSVAFFMALNGMMIAALNKDNHKYFASYMKFKIDEAEKYIGNAQSVEEAVSLVDKYNYECSTYTGSLLNK